MEVYEKINYLIREKGMNKNMFTNKLLELQPRLKAQVKFQVLVQ